jgi:hypothetical protein
VVGLADELADDGGADEARATCQQNLHANWTLRWRNRAALLYALGTSLRLRSRPVADGCPV